MKQVIGVVAGEPVYWIASWFKGRSKIRELVTSQLLSKVF
jgi:hypothetical protein